MKTSIALLFVAVLLCGLPAVAQDVPKAELFLGYEYIHFNPSLGGSGNPNFSMNGGGGAITYNINKMIGLTGEFTQAAAGDIKVCSSTGLNCLTRSGNFFTYLFGPQIAFRGNSKLTPSVHLLFGGSHSNVYANLQQSGTVSTGPTVADANKEAFTLATGVSLDYRASKNIAIRLGQVDYFMTRFSGRYIDTAGTGSAGGVEINNQNNFRYLAGITFYIGRR
jgi:hypothetical protein